jgi:ribosomal protein L37E
MYARCKRCGSDQLSTAWKCHDCGYDNFPEHEKTNRIMTGSTGVNYYEYEDAPQEAAK